MALQSSGLIRLSQIQTEFGGSNPISLSEYYRGGAYVTANNTSVPTSSTITLSNFYGATKQFTFTLSTNQENWDLRSAATTAGWDGSAPLIVNINSGVYVWSDTTATAGLIISGSFAGGLTLNNSGFIMGRGGNGATNGSGAAGGPGVTVSLSSGSASINNQSSGYIGGGGGGGGTKDIQGGGGGGAGGGDSYYKAGGAIGLPGAGFGGVAFTYGEYGTGITSAGGGAGGGGGARDDTGSDTTTQRGSAGGRIFPGTGGRGADARGYGGAGGSAGNAGVNGTGADGNGGGGGGWGASGGNAAGGSAGGAGGAAISGSGYTVTGTTSQIYGSY